MRSSGAPASSGVSLPSALRATITAALIITSLVNRFRISPIVLVPPLAVLLGLPALVALLLSPAQDIVLSPIATRQLLPLRALLIAASRWMLQASMLTMWRIVAAR